METSVENLLTLGSYFMLTVAKCWRIHLVLMPVQLVRNIIIHLFLFSDFCAECN